jgi:hypothetical protein
LEFYYLKRRAGQTFVRPVQPICFLCGTKSNITQEHILPRWVFEKKPDRFFNTTINGLSHKYNQTTIPSCAVCNNNLLSILEKRIIQLLIQHGQTRSGFSIQESSDIIRWLELLDYKYQIFSLMMRFKAIKDKGVIEFLGDFSLSTLDPNIEYSPSKVLRNLRQALQRITVKSKDKMLNSLVLFKTKNPEMHFFHKNNDFLFLELPTFKLALVYFFTRSFENIFVAKEVALATIKQYY